MQQWFGNSTGYVALIVLEICYCRNTTSDKYTGNSDTELKAKRAISEQATVIIRVTM